MKILTLRSAGSDSTRAESGRFFALIVVVALGLAFQGASIAQTTSKIDVHKFEVVSVSGNRLVVRDERGTNAYTVSDDFRMTVDGRKMSVAELKPGMKGTATVTTTTTSKPVFITEVKEGVVLDASPGSITIRNADGERKRFTRDDIDKQGMQIVKDGKAIRIDEAQKGDAIIATIVTKGEPVVVATKEVHATTVAQANPEPPPAPMAKSDAPPPAAEPAPAQPAAAQPAAAAPADAPPAAAAPAATTSEPAGLGTMWWLVIAVLVAAVVFVVARRRKAA